MTANQDNISATDLTHLVALPDHGIYRYAQAKVGTNDVVLKALTPAAAAKPQLAAALRREYATLHKLSHDHLAHAIALVDTPQLGMAIVMEGTGELTLDEWMERHTDADERLDVVMQMASVIDYLHGRGINTLSLRPSAIRLSADSGRATLCAIGLPTTDEQQALPDEQRFLAPEVKDGTLTVDGRADIYALGALLQLLMTDPDALAVAKRCCQLGRSDRFMTGADVTEALQGGGTIGSSNGPSFNPRYIIIALVVAVLAGIGVYFSQRMSQEDEAIVTSSAIEQTDADTTQTVAPAPAATPTATPAAAKQQPAFIAQMLPDLHRDLDRIFAQHQQSDAATLQAAISRYYKGLRRTLKGKTEAEMEAFDKAFASYVSKKKAERKAAQ